MPIFARRAVSLFLVLVAATVASAARADWPQRPIKLIVPYAAGSGPDVVLRPIADALGRELGQPVIVENRGGAGGIVGTQALASAAPDGYTIGFGNIVTLAINKSMYAKLPYDPQRSLAPVSLAISNALVLIAQRPAGQQRAGAGRVREAASGQGQRGIAGRRIQRAFGGRDAQERNRHHHVACAVQERPAGRGGSGRRTA